MQYSTFHALHIGAAHVKKGLPCQDMCLSECDDRYAIAIASDGHGNRRHFRSERGSQKACEIALKCIREFLKRTNDLTPEERASQIQDLKIQICRTWRAAVLEDIANNPWTPEETEEQRQILTDEQFVRFQIGESAVQAYGCTLCAVFAADWGWGSIQVGDGCLTVIEADGTYRWPMPESTINSGHLTASLCSNNPMVDFRHILEDGHPVGLMVYTDGIEKSFPNQGKEIIGLLHWVWKNQRFGDENRLNNLTELLNQVSQRSPFGDDASIAGMIDPYAEDAAPKLNRNLNTKDLRALEIQREELLATIQYNQQRLTDIRRNAPQSEAEQQILQILNRRESDLKTITRAIEEKRALLGLPPLEMPKESPEPELPPEPTEAVSPDAPEVSEAQSSDPDDHYFWGNHESAPTEADSPSRKKAPLPHEKGEASQYQQATQQNVPRPQPQNDPFASFPEIFRLMDESLNNMRDIADDIMKDFFKHFDY